MEAHHRVCFIKLLRLKAIIAIILLVGLCECARDLIKMCSLQKNSKWSSQKRSRPALTYHELLSNFLSRLDLDKSGRIQYVVLVELRWPHQLNKVQRRFCLCKLTLSIFFVLKWERNTNIKDKHSKFQRVGSKCTKAGVQFSSELMYVFRTL